MKSLGLNLVIAVMWLLLGEASPASFAIGLLLGFALIAAFRRVLGSEDYVRRCLAFVRFVIVFVGEFVRANATVAWAVLFRSRNSMHPDFVSYDVAGLSRAEILLLSYCISLTPGTTTVDISEDFSTLVFHALDADDADAIRAEIDRTLKRGILSFTR